jgi:hypothetical protein
MKFPAGSVVWVLPLLLTGCFHRTHQPLVQPLAPPIVDTPPPKPGPSPENLPPPAITLSLEAPESKTVVNLQPHATPKPPAKHHRRAAGNNTQLASNESPSVSAIGQLSSGDPSDLRQPTVDSIAATERSLREINRKLNAQEQKTAAQIREFLKQARAALASGDVYGAHTLAVKAKVLLDELNR